jgi:hypothetical protein
MDPSPPLTCESESRDPPLPLQVEGGFSVACSTAKAAEWDEEWKAAAAAGSTGDQSGRAVKNVHDSATKCF